MGERPVGARLLSTTGVFPLARRRAACAAGQESGADADADTVVGVTVAAAGCKVDSRTDTEIVCTPSADPGAAAAQGPFAKGVGSVAQRWVANAGKEFKGDWSVASDSTETMIGQLFGTRQEYCTDGVHENKMVGTTWKDFTRTGSSCWYARHIPSGCGVGRAPSLAPVGTRALVGVGSLRGLIPTVPLCAANMLRLCSHKDCLICSMDGIFMKEVVNYVDLGTSASVPLSWRGVRSRSGTDETARG